MRKSRQITFSIVIGTIIGIGIEKEIKRKQHLAKKSRKHIPFGPYEAFLKRPLDILLAGSVLIIFSPLIGIIALLVKVKLGSPVFFTQQRPGQNGEIFKIFKFRTMTNKKDENGKLLPDEERLTKFGRMLRSTSLDEVPELINILKGDMSIVGPRPLLVEYMERYNEKQKHRHDVRPGLTGLAQVNGRNNLSWDEKFKDDLIYIKKITFYNDLKIVFKTIRAVIKRDGIHAKNYATMPKFIGNK